MYELTVVYFPLGLLVASKQLTFNCKSWVKVHLFASFIHKKNLERKKSKKEEKKERKKERKKEKNICPVINRIQFFLQVNTEELQ